MPSDEKKFTKMKSKFQTVNSKRCNSEDPCWPANILAYILKAPVSHETWINKQSCGIQGYWKHQFLGVLQQTQLNSDAHALISVQKQPYVLSLVFNPDVYVCWEPVWAS